MLFHKGTIACAEMESNGIRIDVPYLKKTMKEVGEKITSLQAELRKSKEYKVWQKHFGVNAKLGSREQLAKIIFDVMGHKRHLGTSKKSKSEDELDGKRESKYDEATFSDVDLPFVKTYFRCEKLKKLHSTYLKGIESEMVDGFIHPFFDLHKVVTYRGSSSMPNFTNVPIRNKEIGSIIRQCFIARKGRRLVEIDFSGIEVRIACCYTKDPRLISEFTQPGKDPHRDTAAQLFKMPVKFLIENKDWAKRLVRDWAKNRFVFPSFYGSVYFQCAPHLWQGVESGATMPDGKTTIKEYLRKQGIKSLGDCTPGADTLPGTFVDHVKRIEDKFWNEWFTVYTAWKKRRWNEYLRDGGFNLFTGFQCRGIYKKNDVLNYPIQGASFHCLLWTIIQTIKALKKYRMKTLLIGQIHDCQLADVPENEVQDYLSIVNEIITVKLPKAFKWITVPMQAECEVCDFEGAWTSKKVWTQKEGTWGIAA